MKKMLSQIMCYLRTKHKYRRIIGLSMKHIDIGLTAKYAIYICDKCGHEGKFRLDDNDYTYIKKEYKA